jgi:hypothetical protein
MRFKILAFILFLCVFFLCYVILSFLNPDEVKFYFGGASQSRCRWRFCRSFLFLRGNSFNHRQLFFDVKTA